VGAPGASHLGTWDSKDSSIRGFPGLKIQTWGTRHYVMGKMGTVKTSLSGPRDG